MPTEDELRPEMFLRNNLRLKFNWEKIFRKYETMPESGAVVDIVHGEVETLRGADKKAARKACEAFYGMNENFGLAPLSAPGNSPDALDKNKSLWNKCRKRDQQFNEILEVTPFEPPSQNITTRECKIRQVEETFSAKGVSLSKLEDLIREKTKKAKIIYRGIENDVAIIIVRYAKEVTVNGQEVSQQPQIAGEALEEIDVKEEITREFANAVNHGRYLPSAFALTQGERPIIEEIEDVPATQDSILTKSSTASPAPKKKRKSKEDIAIEDEIAKVFSEVENSLPHSSFDVISTPTTIGSPQKSTCSGTPLDIEIEREFESAETKLRLHDYETATNEFTEILESSQNHQTESARHQTIIQRSETVSSVEIPKGTIHPILCRKRPSSLTVSPKSKKSCLRSPERASTTEETTERAQTYTSETFWSNWASDLQQQYIAEVKRKSFMGVEEKFLSSFPTFDTPLIDFWIQATVMYMERFPHFFSSDLIEHETRRQFSAARERNNRILNGYKQ